MSLLRDLFECLVIWQPSAPEPVPKHSAPTPDEIRDDVKQRTHRAYDFYYRTFIVPQVQDLTNYSIAGDGRLSATIEVTDSASDNFSPWLRARLMADNPKWNICVLADSTGRLASKKLVIKLVEADPASTPL